jgi:hypothetical protein
MKKMLIAVVTGLAIAMPLLGTAAPDEAQKLAAAQGASGAERQKMMQEHMTMMQGMMTQMQKAKPGGGMSPEQMREWIDEHMKLMQEMMGQMMGEHHMMMQGGMQGMGKK